MAFDRGGHPPVDFIARLAALVPKPGVNLTRYHGVLAPNHRWRGQVTPEDGGATVHMVDNLWKKISFPYTVTSDTVLEFDFSSSAQGEIHAIGFDNNLVHSPGPSHPSSGVRLAKLF